jgi:hypothetical protein
MLLMAAFGGSVLGVLPQVALALDGTPTVERDPSLEIARQGFLDTRSFATEHAGFGLVVGEHVIRHRVFAVTVLPGDALRVRLDSEDVRTAFRLRFAAGEAWTNSSSEWEWLAPDEPGIYPLRVERDNGDFVHLNVLVMHEWHEVTDGVLYGYAIGAYQDKPLRGDPAYLPPLGFVEATEEDILVSPHFTLGQFLCKQPGDRRFLALSVPLVNKLESVLEAINAEGIATTSLHVMSGFRTPAYNAAIGNTTVYSRHLWGDAADVYVDVDGDLRIDDLNGDGRSDRSDARVLYDIVERLERRAAPGVVAGGLGLYSRNAAHGAFVHVDARGTAVRW